MQRVFCGFNQRVKGSIERSIVCVLRRAVLWDGGRGSASGDSLQSLQHIDDGLRRSFNSSRKNLVVREHGDKIVHSELSLTLQLLAR
jgi:hypothetical protein